MSDSLRQHGYLLMNVDYCNTVKSIIVPYSNIAYIEYRERNCNIIIHFIAAIRIEQELLKWFKISRNSTDDILNALDRLTNNIRDGRVSTLNHTYRGDRSNRY